MQEIVPDSFDSFESETPAIAAARQEYAQVELPTPEQDDVLSADQPAETRADTPEEKPDAGTERNPDGTFKAKPRNDPRARVEQATAKEATAKRERDEARAEAAQLRTDLEALRAPHVEPQRQPQPQADPEPNPDEIAKYPDGQFDRKYLKDQARWEARQEYAQLRARDQQDAARQQREATHQQHTTQFVERLKAHTATDPGFVERLSPQVRALRPTGALQPGERPNFTNAIADVLLQSEAPHRLMEHFTAHPEDFQRLSTLHPGDFFREMGKLEARLDAASSAGPAPVASAISQAKPLIQPVSSAPSASEDDPNAIDDLASFVRENNKRDPRFGHSRR